MLAIPIERWVVYLVVSISGCWVSQSVIISESAAASPASGVDRQSSTPMLVLTGAGKGTILETSVAFSYDGRFIASGVGDGVIKVWDAELGREVLSIGTGNLGHCSMLFDKNSKRIVTSCEKCAIRFWSLDTGRPTLDFNGHEDVVNCFALNRTGRYLVSGSSDRTARIWEVASGKQVILFSGHRMPVTSVSFCSDGKYVASGDSGGGILVWSADDGRKVCRIRRVFSRHVSSVFQPVGGKIAIVGNANDGLSMWDKSSGKMVREFEGHDCVAWSGDGRLLASVTPLYFVYDFEIGNSGEAKHGDEREVGGEIVIWESTRGRKVVSLRQRGFETRGLAFSPDGKRLASVDDTGTVRVWSLAKIGLGRKEK